MPGHTCQEILPLKSWLESQRNPTLNAVVPFQFEGKEFVVIEDKQGQPWFVGSKVCDILGYAHTPSAVQQHCKYAKLLKSGETPHLEIPPRGILIFPESDLYRLIMRSNMPYAEKFQTWVVEQVLPSIRKTGGYIQGEEHIVLYENTDSSILICMW